MFVVGSVTRQTSREKVVVVMMELHRAIKYTTKMSKQVTKSHERCSSHLLCELRCRADTCVQTLVKSTQQPGLGSALAYTQHVAVSEQCACAEY
jgi:hypothetical protein